MLATAVELIIDGVGEDDNGGRDVDDNMGGYGGQRRERGGHGQQTGDGVCRAELDGEERRVNQRGGQKAAVLTGTRDMEVHFTANNRTAFWTR